MPVLTREHHQRPMAIGHLDRRIIHITVGDLSDPSRAAAIRDLRLPPTVFRAPVTAVLDLSGKLVSPAALRELIVRVGQGIRGGVYGDLRLVVATPDEAVREVIELLARQYDIPMYISESSASTDVDRAQPAGALTPADRQTLDELRSMGWWTTVSRLADVVGIEPTAANNRLVNLERKGYIYRFQRGRRSGDLYVDPRAPMGSELHGVDVPQPRDALVAHGIKSDPYDRSALVVEGEAAERAAEILRRRGKAK